MYGGKNTLIRRGVDRREACSPDVILSKNSFFDSFKRRVTAFGPATNDESRETKGAYTKNKRCAAVC